MKLMVKEHYVKATTLLNEVPFNHMFACDVVTRKIDGLIYADNCDAPSVFYIIHPYGMSLLMGDCENEEFNEQLAGYLLNKGQNRIKAEWIQVYPEAWSPLLKRLLGDHLLTKPEKDNGDQISDGKIKVEEQTRVNFKFNPEKYAQFRANHQNKHVEIYRTGEDEFQNMPGTVIPKFFWKDAAQFLEQGVGYSVLYGNQLASTAFSAYIDDKYLEFGIESVEQFRGQGCAKESCVALIDYCLEHGYEPVWACRLENTGSYLLAQLLGFEPVRYLPFYKATP